MLRYKLMLLIWSVLISMQVTAKPLRELSCQFAYRSKKSPVIDGKLDEACWKATPAFTRYRKLYGNNVQLTSLRVLWNEKGLYIGMINQEKHLDRLKVSVRTRDGNLMWEDDSIEIYLDPTGTGSTMFVFQINSIGTIADYWQVDAGFMDTAWSASSAKAVCGRTADAWTLEFFVSWNDLKKTPKADNIWMMMSVRFAHTGDDRKICGTSASGGSFYKRNFGYLYFTDGKMPSPAKLGKKLLKIATLQPWATSVGKHWLYADNNKVKYLNPETIIKSLKEKAEKEISKASAAVQKSSDKAMNEKLTALRKRLNEIGIISSGKDPFILMKKIDTIAVQASALRDEVMFSAILSN